MRLFRFVQTFRIGWPDLLAMVSIVFILAAALAPIGCSFDLSHQDQNQNLLLPQIPAVTPAPGGTPAPTPGACVVPSVRVGPFGFDCDGVPPPKNTDGVLPLACIGVFTATPKDANNVDVPAVIHGPNIAWAVTVGSDVVTLTDFSGEPFNKLVHPVKAGDFTVTATVCGVTGSYSGKVK